MSRARSACAIAAITLFTWPLCAAGPQSGYSVLPKLRPRIRAPIEEVGFLNGIAFGLNETVLLGGAPGLLSVPLSGGRPSAVIPPGMPPAGTMEVERVRSVVGVASCFSLRRQQFIVRLADGKRLLSRAAPDFGVMDMTVAGETLWVLGTPVNKTGADNPEGIALWGGPLTGDFEALRPTHRLSGGENSRKGFLYSSSPYAGAVAGLPDGSVWVVVASEPGLYHYDKNRRLLEILGQGLGELVISRLDDLNWRFATDPVGRYTRILNVQPTIDDLVVTPEGPAIVVREVSDNSVRWSLWYPEVDRLKAVVPLDLERHGPLGNLSCAVRGRVLACLLGTPLSRKATPPEVFRQKYEVVVFDLPAHSTSTGAPGG